jgi:hypothetical protein
VERPQPETVRIWLAVLRRYAVFMTVSNLFWETLHLPLYTIWNEGTSGEIAFAVAHCTGGDLLIALACLIVALFLFGWSSRPAARFGLVAMAATALGVAYTIYSEWLNVEIRRSWTYSDAMPVIPPLGTGLSPLLQWVMLPPLGLRWARRIESIPEGAEPDVSSG